MSTPLSPILSNEATTPVAAPKGSRSLTGLLGRSRTRLALLGVIAALCAVTAARSPVFLSVNNLNNVLQQVAIVGILAAGMTALMVSGGMDLSVGSNLSFSAIDRKSVV